MKNILVIIQMHAVQVHFDFEVVFLVYTCSGDDVIIHVAITTKMITSVWTNKKDAELHEE